MHFVRVRRVFVVYLVCIQSVCGAYLAVYSGCIWRVLVVYLECLCACSGSAVSVGNAWECIGIHRIPVQIPVHACNTFAVYVGTYIRHRDV